VSELTRRLVGAGLALVTAVLVGSVGFLLIGQGRWSWFECLYMTVVSATTVGYGETLPGMEQVPAARVWAVAVILMGVGVFGFAASMLTAWVVESDLTLRFRNNRMRKTIETYEGHMIVCGVGSTGRHVVNEMVATRTPVVAVDVDRDKLEAVARELAPAEVPFVVGDATDDFILEMAGIKRAKGLVTALPDDKDNLFVVVSAHGLNPAARIVSRGHDERVAEKLKKAGATSVVSPNLIGGMRLASEMLRPRVVEFLDEMLRDRDRNLRVEEVTVGHGCPAAFKSIREARLRETTDALVLALRASGPRGFVYNPGPDAVLEPGTILVVLGTQDAVAKLREHLGAR
jgi:voltage-gated potassium channel